MSSDAHFAGGALAESVSVNKFLLVVCCALFILKNGPQWLRRFLSKGKGT